MERQRESLIGAIHRAMDDLHYTARQTSDSCGTSPSGASIQLPSPKLVPALFPALLASPLFLTAGLGAPFKKTPIQGISALSPLLLDLRSGLTSAIRVGLSTPAPTG